jgi:predicted DCC family thiol-disulfide oxidoreductase YuxK
MFKSIEQPVAELTILYDPSCGFCVSCRRWLERQPAYLPLQFVPAGGAAALALYPELAGEAREELTVVSNDGLVYRGASAWIMCLWALCEFREWAQRLSSPALLPYARQAFELLSRNRKTLSNKLGLAPEADLLETLRSTPAPSCGVGRQVAPPQEAERKAGRTALRIVLVAILVWSGWRLLATYREPLLLAALDRGIFTDAKTLRWLGLDVDSVLLQAARQGRGDQVQALLTAGVKPLAAYGSSENPLAAAALAGKTDVVALLRAAGFDVDARTASGHTALMDAALKGSLPSVRNLLQAGADPKAADVRQVTPLLFAVQSATDAAIVRELLQAGAAVDAADTAGDTPLMAAADRGWTEAVCALLLAGADPNAQDSLGRNALLRMVMSPRPAARRIETLQALLAAGANPRLPDRQGTTALDLVTRRRDPGILLLFAGTTHDATPNTGR